MLWVKIMIDSLELIDKGRREFCCKGSQKLGVQTIV